jgi:hypothetical protein
VRIARHALPVPSELGKYFMFYNQRRPQYGIRAGAAPC